MNHKARVAHLTEALSKALNIIQFSLANLDGNVKNWPEEDIRTLGRIVHADDQLTPLQREVGMALQVWAKPTTYHGTVAKKPRPRKRST